MIELKRTIADLSLDESLEDSLHGLWKLVCETLLRVEVAPAPLRVRVRWLLWLVDIHALLLSRLSRYMWGPKQRAKGCIRHRVSQMMVMLNSVQARTLLNVVLSYPFVPKKNDLANRHWSSSSLCRMAQLLFLQVRVLKVGLENSDLVRYGGLSSKAIVSSDVRSANVVYAGYSCRTKGFYIGSTTRGCGARQM